MFLASFIDLKTDSGMYGLTDTMDLTSSSKTRLFHTANDIWFSVLEYRKHYGHPLTILSNQLLGANTVYLCCAIIVVSAFSCHATIGHHREFSS